MPPAPFTQLKAVAAGSKAADHPAEKTDYAPNNRYCATGIVQQVLFQKCPTTCRSVLLVLLLT
jgi:hypothetical protein